LKDFFNTHPLLANNHQASGYNLADSASC
jgi:hypothetical protein